MNCFAAASGLTRADTEQPGACDSAWPAYGTALPGMPSAGQRNIGQHTVGQRTVG